MKQELTEELYKSLSEIEKKRRIFDFEDREMHTHLQSLGFNKIQEQEMIEEFYNRYISEQETILERMSCDPQRY